MNLSSQEDIVIGDFAFPTEPLISVTLSKQIIETVVPGRKGTVKELIRVNDAEITITGILVPEPDSLTPDEDLFVLIESLKELFDENERVTVYSRLLSTLGIEYVVISELDIPAEAGGLLQHFTLKLKEDSEILEFE